ncbi:FAD:protein FMN transferase [Vibrio sp. 99-8-1]|uniref:FAD:protein FMN transferase n=1 Tax=Vibrio sp. 99-8-1 TaxID=2607602 RepID=UPI001493A112|nr:FAD:protein FMN transferase [Vibrio sp. 99-8-1]NOI64912.1 FAD:protein FMN transferase [Vibrio sp. 99-8-1]
MKPRSNTFVTKFKLLLLALSSLLFVTACSDSREQTHLTGPTMGTSYNVKYINADSVPASDVLQKEIDRLLEQVNDQMSTYRKTSELSRFNQYKSSDEFAVSKETVLVVKEAIRLNQLTLGALDVTVGPLVNLWGFGPEGRPEVVPSDEELAARRANVGIEHLTVTEKGLSKDIPDLYVDLSTIAKGWGVDVVANYIESQGIENYMVEVGGEIRMKGKNRENIGWRIAIEKPDVDQRAVQEIIEPGDMAVATSGDYRNYFERDGIRYSHIIDPETGKPINHKVVSVTALHPSCMTADGLATGLMVLGEEVAMKVANEHDLAVFMVVKTEDGFKEVYSDAFSRYLKK